MDAQPSPVEKQGTALWAIKQSTSSSSPDTFGKFRSTSVLRSLASQIPPPPPDSSKSFRVPMVVRKELIISQSMSFDSIAASPSNFQSPRKYFGPGDLAMDGGQNETGSKAAAVDSNRRGGGNQSSRSKRSDQSRAKKSSRDVAGAGSRSPSYVEDNQFSFL